MTIPPALILWVFLFLVSRYVSLASIGASIAVAVAGWIFYYHPESEHGWIVPTILTLLGTMGVWRHRSNIKRLLDGTENRFDFSKKRKKQDENSND